MKLDFDLFLMMFKLSRLSKKEDIIQHFIDDMHEAFSPAVFKYHKKHTSRDESVVKIRTQNSQFGFIVIKSEYSIDKNSRILIDNAIQMLAIILGQLESGIELERYKKKYPTSISLSEDLLYDEKKQSQAEEAIKTSEARLKRAELASKSGNWELHNDTLKMIASDGATKIFGVTGDNFDYSFVKKFTLPEYRPLLDQTLKNLIKENIPYDIEFKIIAGDTGQIKDIHSIATFDRKKRIVFGVIQDITHQKLVTKELEKSEDQFKNLVKSMQVGVLLQGPETEILLCNPVALEMLGLSEEQLLGKTSFDPDWKAIHEDGSSFPVSLFPVPQAILTRKSVRNVVMGVYIPITGSYVWLQVDADPLFNTDGSVRQVVCTFIDISGRKNAEAQIKKLNENLELRVLERTQQLEVANKELESFSYSASHDLRTPLRALDGFANILLEDYSQVLDDEGKRMLRIIIDNANKMGRLIDDLLSFSRLGKLEMELTKINMQEMAGSIYNDLLTEKDTGLIQFSIQNIPDAYGDPSLMRQVWTNLIANAIKFSSKKSDRTIEIGYKTDVSENIYYVKDNGEGFDMRHSVSLFAVFKRLPTAKNFEGTGVGLAIVHRIINRMNGRIWAEGIAGKGATFYFALPATYKIQQTDENKLIIKLLVENK